MREKAGGGARGIGLRVDFPRPRIASIVSVLARACRSDDTLDTSEENTMDSTLQALIVKKFKDAEMDLDVGRHWIDEMVVLWVSGTVERHEDQWIAPTISIPLIPTIAFFWERLGVEKDAAMSVLREAIAEAMRAKTNESPAIKSKMDDVAEAVAAVKRDLIGKLPRMRRAGRTDVSDLKVSINALTPVSEPLYAVA
jgi:hypothetical protein